MVALPLELLTFGDEIRQSVPEALIPLFILITRLGNAGFFLTLFTLDYWFGDHERGAHAIGLAIAGVALITLLKSFFAAPRPPEAVNVIPITGYSFPSGHATGATIAYGILAFDLKISTRRSRFAVAAALVALVALSRVVLGVHFVRDVVAGVAVGIVFLAAAIPLTGHKPRPGFWLAAGISTAAVVVSSASHNGLAVLGIALGALLVWETLGTIRTVEARSHKVMLVIVVLPLLAAVGYLMTLTTFAPQLVFLLGVLLSAGILTAPLFVGEFSTAQPSESV